MAIMSQSSDVLQPKISYTFDDKPIVRRGDIWLADMSLSLGSEQTGIRYVLVVSNNIGNTYSPAVKVCCITSQNKTSIPTHVYLPKGVLPKDSIIMTEQIRTIDKMRLLERKGRLGEKAMRDVKKALMISLDLL